MTPELEIYCKQWSRDVAGIREDKARMAYFQAALPKLLLDSGALRPVLENMAGGRRWPAPGNSGLFENEVLLYLDPSRRFSLRLYFHAPRSHTAIHDHSGWGVSGVPFGGLSVVRYALQGAIRNESARLKEKGRTIFEPGQVETTPPWDAGIHKTGSPDDALNVMVSVYGRPGRRLYINIFDPENQRVERRYPVKYVSRQLAREALGGLKKG